MLLYASLFVTQIFLTRVNNVRLRWKSLPVCFQVEKTHGVPATSDVSQTRRRETKRIAGRRVNRHLSSKRDVFIHHVAKTVSGAVGFQCRIIIIVGIFYRRHYDVKQLATPVHLTVQIVLHTT